MIKIIEDSGGGLWLTGEDELGRPITTCKGESPAYYGDLQWSEDGAGLVEMLTAWEEGTASYNHDQADTETECEQCHVGEPSGTVVAAMDGEHLRLYIPAMGRAAKRYFFGGEL